LEATRFARSSRSETKDQAPLSKDEETKRENELKTKKEKKKKSLLPSAVAAAIYRRRQNKNEQLRKDNEQKDINLHTLTNG